MHTTIQVYAGMSGHAGRFAARRIELERAVTGVPGLVRFQLLETAEGVAAVIACLDRAGCEECVRRTVRWMDEHMPDLRARHPLVVDGSVIAEATAPAPG